MNNLVPEKRLDKNNRLVTKYVKPAGAGLGGENIPSPTTTISTRSRDLRNVVLRMKDDYELRDIPEDQIVAKFDSLSDDTLRLIMDSTGEGSDQVHPSEVAFVVHRGFSETVLREYLTFSLDVIDCEDGDGTVGYVQALHQYSKLKKHKDLSVADEKTQQACHTLLKVTWMYSAFNYDDPAIKLIKGEDGMDFPMLKSTALVNMILDNPDRGDDIIEFLDERGYKISALKEMLATAPRALRDGWL